MDRTEKSESGSLARGRGRETANTNGLRLTASEGGAGGFRFDVAFLKLKGLYPQNRITSGPRTEQEFVDVLERAGGDPEVVFGRMLSNLATQKAGQQWQDTDMIPKLENWLKSGAWEQVHQPPTLTESVRLPEWARQAKARQA